MKHKTIFFFGIGLLFFNCVLCAFSENTAVKTQTLYVPVYSSIFHGDQERELNLAVTVSIRNTDMKNAIMIEWVNYYDTSGKLINRYLTKFRKLKPLESIYYMIKESDVAGGIGANVIVKWSSNAEVSAPIVEAVMIGTRGQQGISFTSRGVMISEK